MNYEDLICNLLELKKSNPIKYLKKLNEYRESNPQLYRKLMSDLKVKEFFDEPVDMMRANEEAGPLNVNPQVPLHVDEDSEPFNWRILFIIVGAVFLIIVFIILFLINFNYASL